MKLSHRLKVSNIRIVCIVLLRASAPRFADFDFGRDVKIASFGWMGYGNKWSDVNEFSVQTAASAEGPWTVVHKGKGEIGKKGWQTVNLWKTQQARFWKWEITSRGCNEPDKQAWVSRAYFKGTEYVRTLARFTAPCHFRQPPMGM